ncbi:MAG: Octanoyltransferase LipM [Promethearchaeota archaeon]|nr:MAG: Octanoyltransferase LipM [Candidatus Lokiarchaeota archaeon]
MNKDWRIIPLKTNNGYWNMALDEAILKAVIEKKSPNTIRFYKWDPSTVSIGRNQSLSVEVDMKTAKKENYNVVRRITGGGAVFHDKKGEITYSIICPIKFLKQLDANKVIEQFEIIEKGIIKGLSLFGLNAEEGIIHCPALFLDGKKFSGNAQVRKKKHILQHGTILLEIDPERMYSVLKAPNNVSKTRMVKSVYAKCIGIKERFEKFEEQRFLEFLKQGFKEVLKISLKESEFTNYEMEVAKDLVKNKYQNEKWLKKYE